jgi:succinoglycan biosynthesis protein ExoM
MRLAVCIATYRRHDGALRCLEALLQQKFSSLPRPEITLAIVSNEEDPKLEKIFSQRIQALGSEAPWLKVIYATETRRGIPFARNLASRLAMGQGSEFLCYIDDDEVPDVSWLEALLLCQSESSADIVYGAVESRLVGASPFWERHAWFFKYPRYERGVRLRHAYTHNVLVRSKVFEALGGFDERWGLNGGDDNAFFRRAAVEGFQIVACPESVVVESIGPSRANLKYFCRRSFRYGNSEGLLEVLGPSLRGGRSICALRALAMLGLGALRSLAALLSCDPKRSLLALSKLLFAAGLLTGCLGWRYEIYRASL